ncbi:hypothetical protein ElyMa_005287700 [Elysia marginata]|uniref:Uncharacterized protein n=1 Tax=Elysia marginata TaxID=1093978 RepID=A0AAV4K1K1_9GAST|nr:hypothetical protein ElyMa_005287700 [Elysia marginata]
MNITLLYPIIERTGHSYSSSRKTHCYEADCCNMQSKVESALLYSHVSRFAPSPTVTQRCAQGASAYKVDAFTPYVDLVQFQCQISLTLAFSVPACHMDFLWGHKSMDFETMVKKKKKKEEEEEEEEGKNEFISATHKTDHDIAPSFTFSVMTCVPKD